MFARTTAIIFVFKLLLYRNFYCKGKRFNEMEAIDERHGIIMSFTFES